MESYLKLLLMFFLDRTQTPLGDKEERNEVAAAVVVVIVAAAAAAVE